MLLMTVNVDDRTKYSREHDLTKCELAVLYSNAYMIKANEKMS